MPDRRSVVLSLTTTSQRCYFTDQQRSKGDKCEVDKLEPFTDYVCQAQARYGGYEVGKPASVNVKTKSDKPDDVDTLSVSNPENNAIKVTCNHSRRFHGPGGKYIARLSLSGHLVTEKENTTSKCEFEFKDLSYLTAYEVEVAAVNRDYPIGTGKTKEVDTLDEDKVVIRILIFFTVAFLALGIFGIKKTRAQSDTNEEELFQSTAIYSNVPDLDAVMKKHW
ncbi:receptor-type tyrosine-protein phosphatase C-like [Cheilinus undulatus]|uniref:receptor-type tyrosine-protein phosphatase C-like n=1 Tax=Cheilinus undulatus TaxID=241271 RepID=UPI001BD48CB6|nr:receptor-type tyrosine-protein phosphatase C-like [Cheilinus undulatus]